MPKALTYTSSLTGEIIGPLPKDLYGYELALTVAGIKIYSFQQFGSYQGHWVAHVKLPDGRVGWIIDYYGSCSGCDSFEAQFDYNASDSPDYGHKLVEFAKEYIDKFMTQNEAETEASREISWSVEDQEMYDYIKARRDIIEAQP